MCPTCLSLVFSFSCISKGGKILEMQGHLQESPIMGVYLSYVPAHISVSRILRKQIPTNTAINNAVMSIYGNLFVLY